MIYTTLKANKEHGIDYLDIALYTDECWTSVALLFDECKYGDEDNTDLDKLMEDYTERQIASTCLKYLRQRAKDKDECLMIWNKIFFDLDGDGEIAYDQLETLIANGVITGANQLREIKNKAQKKGHTIKKGYRYGENDIYYGVKTVNDLIDEHFPCYADLNDDYCNNCGNCQ